MASNVHRCPSLIATAITTCRTKPIRYRHLGTFGLESPPLRFKIACCCRCCGDGRFCFFPFDRGRIWHTFGTRSAGIRRTWADILNHPRRVCLRAFRRGDGGAGLDTERRFANGGFGLGILIVVHILRG